MLIILLLTVVSALITYVYMLRVQLTQYWAKRNVPHDPPHPVFGSLAFFHRDNCASWFRYMYERYKVPYVGIWLFWRPGLLIQSEEIARNILIRDQANFRNRYSSSGSSDVVGRLTLPNLKDPHWSAIRKRLSMLFTGSKLRGVQNLVTQKSKELVQRIENERQKPEPVNIRDLIIDYSTDVTGTSVLGLASDATLTGDSLIRNITKDFTDFNFFRALSWCCIFFIPDLVNIFRLKMYPTHTTDTLRKILRTVIAQRGGLEKKVTEPRDLLDVLVKIKQDHSKEVDMSENMMVAQIAILLQGGYETSAIALSFCFYELAFHPQVQNKLYKELQEANDKYADILSDTNILSQLKYLNCVINETLRKYPIIPMIDRVALEDYKVDDRLTIKAGTPVLVNILGFHYDPNFFSEPHEFNPDRFLLENESIVKPFTFLPFGDGPRKCIGQRLGMSTVTHGLAAVLLKYEFRPLPNSPKPSELKFDKKTVFTAPEEILSVEFVPRV